MLSKGYNNELLPAAVILIADTSLTPGPVTMPGMADGSLTPSSGMDTPLMTRGLQQLRQKIEEELGKQPRSGGATNSISPGLARLRNTPGGLEY